MKTVWMKTIDNLNELLKKTVIDTQFPQQKNDPN